MPLLLELDDQLSYYPTITSITAGGSSEVNLTLTAVPVSPLRPSAF